MPLTPEEFPKTMVLFVAKFTLWISDHLLLPQKQLETESSWHLWALPAMSHPGEDIWILFNINALYMSPSGELNRKTASHKQDGPHNISVRTSTSLL